MRANIEQDALMERSFGAGRAFDRQCAESLGDLFLDDCVGMGEPLRPEADECVHRSHAAGLRAMRRSLEIRVDEHLEILHELILQVCELVGIQTTEDVGDRPAGVELRERCIDDLREDAPVEQVDAGKGFNGLRAVRRSWSSYWKNRSPLLSACPPPAAC